jgi:hypothetical protein
MLLLETVGDTMITVENTKSTAIEFIKKALAWEPNASMDCLWAKLAQTGKMSTETITRYTAIPSALEQAPEEDICLLYQALWQNEWPQITALFDAATIENADRQIATKYQDAFPLKFQAISLSNHDEYFIALSAQEINTLVQNGILQIRTDMQRESVITAYHGQLISHVRYDDDWARTIGQAFSDGDGYSSALRWNLVIDGTERYDYDAATSTLTIYSGCIAIIGGQHRTRALEYALYKNPHLDLKMGIFFTIATPERAQFIINQDESRLEINKEHKQSMADSAARRIVRLLQTNPELADFKFITTPEEYKAGGGFILVSQAVQAIESCKPSTRNKHLSAKKVRTIANWLTEFLVELEDSIEHEMSMWSTSPQPLVCPNAFNAYFWLAFQIEEHENWKSELPEIISNFKFLLGNLSHLRQCGGKGHITTFISTMEEAYKRVQ